MYNYQILVSIKPQDVILDKSDLEIVSTVFPVVEQAMTLHQFKKSFKTADKEVGKEITCVYNFKTNKEIISRDKLDLEKKIEYVLKTALNKKNFKWKSVMVLLYKESSDEDLFKTRTIGFSTGSEVSKKGKRKRKKKKL